ncbi:L-type lectin-domain containing receptor kinase IX.2 [Triticum aestivum]|nr:L-type lectin-domain containing receptor kinase IX.2-like [Triticum aestivum]
MGSPASTGGGSAQLLLILFILILVTGLHLSGAQSHSPTPNPVAVASPFSFSFDFTNKSNYRPEDLKFEGDATPRGDRVDVTCDSHGDESTNCSGRLSYAHPVPLFDSTTGEVASFQTCFKFLIHIDNSTSKDGGSGMAFFLGNFESTMPPDSYEGGLGLMPSLFSGFALRTNQFIAVEFDTFQDALDPNPNSTDDHIGIDINSVSSENWTSLGSIGLRLRGYMTATISFNSTTQMLVANLQFDDHNNSVPVQVSRQLPFPINTLLPAQVAVGFSAATGLSMDLHQILSWSFNSSLALPDEDDGMDAVVIVVSIVGAVVLAAVLWCILSCFMCRRRTRSHDIVTRTGGPKEFEYRVLAAATDDFSEARVIGQGAFGVVYRGTLSSNGSSWGASLRELGGLSSKESCASSSKESDSGEVAVKKILNKMRGGNLDFFTEMNTISAAKHKNLVKLKGWCCRKHSRNILDCMCWCCRKKKHDELFLVYELVPNGNLQYHLHESEQVIAWPTRYQIVKGIGSALVYLHHECDPYILHRDIKPANILLDNNFNAKLADFGLSRVGNQDNATLMTLAQGTEGYIDPECRKDGKVKFYPRSDVYSFGIVLLDIVCTRKSREQVWELYKGGMIIEAVDERLHGDDFDRWQTQMQRVAVLGLWCSLLDGAKRPTIQKAMEFLERDHEPLPNLNYAVNSCVPSTHHDAYTSRCSDEQTLMSDVK